MRVFVGCLEGARLRRIEMIILNRLNMLCLVQMYFRNLRPLDIDEGKTGMLLVRTRYGLAAFLLPFLRI